MSNHKKTILCLVFIVLIIKTILFCWAFYGFDFETNPHENFFSIWDRWDTGSYKIIATEGYSSNNITDDQKAFLSHFFPFFPLLLAVFLKLFLVPVVYSGFAVSLIASLLSSYFLYKLVFLDFKNKRIAFLSVIFMNLYPTSYFTMTLYSESLFIFLVITAFYFMRKENFLTMGLSGAGAMLTRVTGLSMLPVYLFLIWKKRKNINLKIFFPLILFAGSFIIYFLINHVYYGDFLYFFKETESFNVTKQLIFPLKETFANFYITIKHLPESLSDNNFMFTQGFNSIFTILSLLLVAVGIRKKIPGEYIIYSLSSILFFSSFSWGISNARYTFVIFPIFIVLALIKNKYLQYGFLAFSTLMLFYFVSVFTSGAWAF